MSVGKAKALVLGSDTRSFLAVVRSLGRSGLEVHSAWTDSQAIARSSRYLKQTFEIDHPRDGGDRWVGQLNELQREHDYQIIIPCNDQSIIPIREQQQRIDHYRRYYILDDDTYEIVNSKIESTRLANALGIPTPRCKNNVTEDDLDEVIEQFGFPVVLKPESSFVGHKLSRKQTVATVRTAEALGAKLSEMRSVGSVQIQEYFQGEGTGVEFLACDGEILQRFQHLRVHEPIGGGGSSYRKSIALHEGMLDATEKFVRKLNYSGVGMVEFLWNRTSGQWRFVEINGRFWGSLPLALFSGVDFPASLYHNRIEKRATFPGTYRVGVHSRNLTSDKNWLSNHVRSRESGFISKLIGLGVGGVSGVGRFLIGKEHVDTFAWGDPKPFLVEVLTLAQSVGSGVLRKLKSKIRHSNYRRRRGRSRMRSLLSRSNSVLFVCKGNICRSPFAEMYLRHRLEEFDAGKSFRVGSAGYFPKDGRPSPENAKLAADRLGVCLKGHRSRRMTEQLARDSDLIVVFDEENYDRILGDYPEAVQKLVFLNDSVEGGRLVVDDPYGTSEKDFVATYRSIATAIDAMMDRLDRENSTSRSSYHA